MKINLQVENDALKAEIASIKNEISELKVKYQSQSELLNALDSASVIAMTDKYGNIIYANDMFCKISQYSRDELIGQNHRILKSGLHSKEFYKHLWNTISSGKPWEGEVQNKAKDGSYYWVETIIVPILDEDSKPCKYVSIRYLITEKKKAETELKLKEQKLLEAQKLGKIGNYEVDYINKTWTCSNFLAEMIGLNSKLPLKLNTFEEIIDENDRKRVFDEFEYYKKNLISNYEIEYKINHLKNNEVLCVRDTGKIVFDEFGQLVKSYGTLQNISKMKFMLEELEQSNKFINSLTATVPEDLMIYDLNQNQIVYSNKKISSVTQYNFEDFNSMGVNLFEHFIHPIDLVNVKQNLVKLNQGTISKIHNSIYRIRNIRNTYIWAVFQTVVFDRNPDGSVAQIVVSITDVDKIIKQQEIISLQRNQLHSILENTSDMIWAVDRNNLLIFANQAYIDFRKNIAKAPIQIGANIFDTLPQVSQKNWLPHIKKCFSGEKVTLEGIDITYSPEKLILDYQLNPIFNDKNEVVGIAGTATNKTVSHIKTIEIEKYRNSLDTALSLSSIGYWKFAKTGNHFYSNKSNQELLNIDLSDSDEQITVNDFLNIVHHEDREKLYNAMQLAMLGFSESMLEYRIVSSQNQIKHILAKYLFIDNADDQWLVHGVNIDISHLKEIELELNKTLEEKNQFFTIVTHDIKSPLNGFINLLNDLNENFENLRIPEIQRIGLQLQKSAQNLLSLLENLLNWTYSQSGLLKAKFEPVIVCSAIESILQLHQLNLNKKNISINFICPQEIKIYADKYMFDTVMRNVLSNAIKYSPENETITIQVEENNKNTYISVIDRGIGMSEEKIISLFSQIYIEPSAGTLNEIGTGIGIKICDKFMQYQNGTLDIQSMLGMGTTVRLIFNL